MVSVCVCTHRYISTAIMQPIYMNNLTSIPKCKDNLHKATIIKLKFAWLSKIFVFSDIKNINTKSYSNPYKNKIVITGSFTI